MKKQLLNWFLGGGEAFSPTSLTPTAWWDNGATYMAADGSQWTDRMGNYNLTAAGTARPTYTTNAQNGLPSYTFDGTTDVLAGSRITQIQGSQNFTALPTTTTISKTLYICSLWNAADSKWDTVNHVEV